MAEGIVAVAGAGGDLGGRIVKALVARGSAVRALIRPEAARDAQSRIAASGATIVAADPDDIDAMTAALAGAACVVSALNGLGEVMIDRQTVLLDAAVKANVQRFIPSDYAADFTRTRPGDNRNFDLRRAFMGIADRAPIQVTSILNGAFMDMLGREMPIIQPKIRRVLYWRDADQLLDFTLKDDVAAYVASAAQDEAAPRILRIAGDSVSVRDIAAAMTLATGERYRPLWAGGIGSLGVMIALTQKLAPGAGEAFPPWQGMQYMRDQFSGRAKLETLDNDRYPGINWTSVRTLLTARTATE